MEDENSESLVPAEKLIKLQHETIEMLNETISNLQNYIGELRESEEERKMERWNELLGVVKETGAFEAILKAAVSKIKEMKSNKEEKPLIEENKNLHIRIEKLEDKKQ